MIDINVLGNMTSERHYVNAETFDVGRWKRPEIKNISPYAFTPFHSGPRNCIGQHMVGFFFSPLFTKNNI
jgi:cytochrome P450